MELMPASEAKKFVDEMRDEETKQLKKVVIEAINEAVNKGMYKTSSIEIPFAKQSRIKKWLSSLGYEVECGDSQKDGPWFIVSWHGDSAISGTIWNRNENQSDNQLGR